MQEILLGEDIGWTLQLICSINSADVYPEESYYYRISSGTRRSYGSVKSMCDHLGVLEEWTEKAKEKTTQKNKYILSFLSYQYAVFLPFYGVPHDEEGYEAFAAYAKALAEHLKGKVSGFEIWNEWNGGSWNGGYGNEEYVEIVKHVYTAVKAVDPDIKIAAGAAITAPSSWFDTLFSMGMFDYCDVISYHPYCYPDNPDEKTYRGNIEDNFERMYKVMEKYGEPKEQWLTEWGWYTGTAGNNVSYRNQASFITRGYINGIAYGLDRIYIYDFKNDGKDESYSEYNYGIINSWEEAETVKYAAKQSYVATAAIINKLHDVDFVDEYRPLTDARVYKFERGNEEIIAMYYIGNNNGDITSAKISLKGETAGMQAYDIFGNSIDKVDEINGSVIYLVGEKGQFNIDDVCVEKRESVNISFGVYKSSDGLYVSERHDHMRAGDYNCVTIGRDMKFDEIACNVDDSYIYGGINAVDIEVMYFDDISGEFYLEYSDAEGNCKRSEPVTLTNTGDWQTAKLHIDDAGFTNSIGGNKDLIIKLQDAENESISFGGIRITKTQYEHKREMSVSFEKEEDFAELPNQLWRGDYLINGDKAVSYLSSDLKGFSFEEKGGRGSVYLTGKGEALYIFVDADDSVLFGNFSPVKVSIDYYDEGKGTFTIAYDIGDFTSFKEAAVTTLSDTKTWKTAEYILTDCWWKNYLNYKTDFRIALWAPSMGRSPEGIAFGKVSIEVLDDVEDKEITDAAFSDISGHWSEDIMTDMAKKGIISGYEDGTARPDNAIKVNEFITLLMQKMGYTVAETDSTWDGKYITRALELGIIKNGEFDSYSREISRAEIARIAARVSGAAEIAVPETVISEIRDFDDAPAELQKYVAGVYYKDIMRGDGDGCFYPNRTATRAETAVILSKF